MVMTRWQWPGVVYLGKHPFGISPLCCKMQLAEATESRNAAAAAASAFQSGASPGTKSHFITRAAERRRAAAVSPRWHWRRRRYRPQTSDITLRGEIVAAHIVRSLFRCHILFEAAQRPLCATKRDRLGGRCFAVNSGQRP